MSNESSGPRRPRLLWDQHCCLPLERRADVGELARYRRPGGSFVSVNVGYVPHSADDVVGLIASWRERIAADDRLRLAVNVDDIEAAGRAGDVAVAFDLEDSGPLDGRLDRVRQFYDLGVRTMLPLSCTALLVLFLICTYSALRLLLDRVSEPGES
ncbi:membrane dipeptidase [Streptomyces antimycoticus]|uniref:membrane dipeptidase n=1 Tax=Streptomyces TaxID=1883 RepID=UPI0036EBD1CB